MFNLLYLIVCTIFYILSLPIIFILSFKEKYKKSLPAKFFLINNRPFSKVGIHIHACSLGEVISIIKIIEILKGNHINITVITQSGYNQALKIKDKYQNISVRYLPFELFLPFWIKNTTTTIVTEAELWYELFRVSKKANNSTILLNARISSKSYKKYYMMRWLYRKIFANIDMVLSQSEDDSKRLISVGAINIKTIGNIKLLNDVTVTRKLTKPKNRLIVASSTHEGEEDIICEAYKLYGKGKLVVVPRHSERFNRVDTYLQKFSKENSYSYSRFSDDEKFNSDITLCDKLGELINIYAISDIVILGGAFKKLGGHNPLEPANFKNKIISGIHIFNQKELFRFINNVQYAIDDKEDLFNILKNSEALQYSTISANIDINILKDEINKIADKNR